jgi:hypothetical protein
MCTAWTPSACSRPLWSCSVGRVCGWPWRKAAPAGLCRPPHRDTGGSRVFECGVCAYADEIKINFWVSARHAAY